MTINFLALASLLLFIVFQTVFSASGFYDPFRADRPLEYSVVTNVRNVWQLQRDCGLLKGGRIAVIRDENELRKAKEEIESQRGIFNVFIGLSDAKKENVFRWLDSSIYSPRNNYIQWMSREPSDNAHTENCIWLRHATHVMDEPCEKKGLGLCEKGDYTGRGRMHHGTLFNTDELYGALDFIYHELTDTVKADGQIILKQATAPIFTIMLLKRETPSENICKNFETTSLGFFYRRHVATIIEFEDPDMDATYAPFTIHWQDEMKTNFSSHSVLILRDTFKKIACQDVEEYNAFMWYKSIGDIQFANIFEPKKL